MATLRREVLQTSLLNRGKACIMVDNDYDDVMYVTINGYYVFEAPKDLQLPSYEDGYHFRIVHGIQRRVEDMARDSHDFTFKEFKTHVGKKVAVFTDGEQEVYVNVKFFKAFHNGVLTKDGFAKNITFTGNRMNTPLFAWQDNDLVGMYCPIMHN